MALTTTVRAGAVATAIATTATLGLTATPAGADLGAPTSTSAQTVTRTPKPMPRLVDIRTGRHDAFDRVVLDLHGKAPGYTVRYVKAVREDASGRVVELRGKAQLVVRLAPARAHRADGSATYTGPTRIATSYPELREVAFAGDFEGVVTIGLGVRARHGFRVLTLHDPSRIVIDIAH
jgi:hypothetical protein